MLQARTGRFDEALGATRVYEKSMSLDLLVRTYPIDNPQAGEFRKLLILPYWSEESAIDNSFAPAIQSIDK
jgi:hypothetical protein